MPKMLKKVEEAMKTVNTVVTFLKNLALIRALLLSLLPIVVRFLAEWF